MKIKRNMLLKFTRISSFDLIERVSVGFPDFSLNNYPRYSIKSMVLGHYTILYKIVITYRLSPHSVKYFTVYTYFILFLKETLLNFIILMNCHGLICASS